MSRKNKKNKQENIDQFLRDFIRTQDRPVFEQIKHCPDAILHDRFIKRCMTDLLIITGETLKELEKVDNISHLEKDNTYVEIMRIFERVMRALRGEREEFIKKFCIRQKDIILKNFEKYVKNQKQTNQQ